MKVGVVSFQRSISYGAFFQCYALQRVLGAMGYDVEHVDYQPAHRIQKLEYHRRWYLNAIWPRAYAAIPARRVFAKAIREHINLSSRRVASLGAVDELSGVYNALICGSDQIWNPMHTGGVYDPVYFLNFGRPGIRRISYAASFGRHDYPLREDAVLREKLSRLDSISVREKRSQDILASDYGLHCDTVCDPTLLWNEYPLQETSTEGRYIFSFSILRNEEYCAREREVSEKLGCRIVTPKSRWSAFSPFQWLHAIKNAELVLTDSFHCISFALKFQKPLVPVSRARSMKALNMRVLNLLEVANSGVGVVCSSQDVDEALEKSGQIDWIKVAESLAAEAERGKAFLRKGLSPTSSSIS